MIRLILASFFILLTACNSETDSEQPSLESGGLPQSQRTQEDSPAGVKFNEKKPFKSLSDSADQ